MLMKILRISMLLLLATILLVGCSVNGGISPTSSPRANGDEESADVPVPTEPSKGNPEEGGDNDADSNGDSDSYTIVADGSFMEVNGVRSNAPVLMDGMLPIIFADEDILTDFTQIPEFWIKADSQAEWYDYSAGVKQWANAVTEDGSMWVWIPRFAYRIASGLHRQEDTKGTIEIQFIDNDNRDSNGQVISTEYPEVSGDAMLDFVVHPAFSTDLSNGGWDKDISGFWVSKFEMADGVTENDFSKPGWATARALAIGKAYKLAFNFDRSKESHMLKNSEWGAIAYLASSAYGSDEDAITRNITGAAGSGEFEYGLDTLQSTTGTIYGVYDMVGGGGDFTAAYLPAQIVLTAAAAGSLGGTDTSDMLLFISSTATKPDDSTKYITIYDMAEDGPHYEMNSYLSEQQKFGDSIYETSSGVNALIVRGFSWADGTSAFPSDDGPYFFRGGMYSRSSYTSIFSFEECEGGTTTLEICAYHAALIG